MEYTNIYNIVRILSERLPVEVMYDGWNVAKCQQDNCLFHIVELYSSGTRMPER